MGSFSIIHWVFILGLLVLLGWPVGRILRRTGHSGFWAVFYFVPLLNAIGLWVLAYKRWPSAVSRNDAGVFS